MIFPVWSLGHMLGAFLNLGLEYVGLHLFLLRAWGPSPSPSVHVPSSPPLDGRALPTFLPCFLSAPSSLQKPYSRSAASLISHSLPWDRSVATFVALAGDEMPR